MTRTYALKRLLEHGGLTRAEIAAITGWPEGAVRSAIARLCELGEIVGTRKLRGSVYEVAR